MIARSERQALTNVHGSSTSNLCFNNAKPKFKICFRNAFKKSNINDNINNYFVNILISRYARKKQEQLRAQAGMFLAQSPDDDE